MSRAQQGLTQHLEASHDLFVYGYPDDVNALRVVSVEPRDDIYTSASQFQSLEANIMKDPVNKVNLLPIIIFTSSDACQCACVISACI